MIHIICINCKHRSFPASSLKQIKSETLPLLCLSSFIAMADMDRSSDDVSADSTENSSQPSKVEFSEDEETLIARMYNLVGERWSLIAGRIPGRTAEEIEKYWNSRYSTSE